MTGRALLAIAIAAAAAQAEPASAPVPPPAPAAIDDVELTDAELAALLADSEIIDVVDAAPPGARSSVDAATLERDEPDDIHAVLGHVPGVYVRDEDGYGLRPNIGMRGAAAERSAKITLMEDGVLIAPAPYAAPAAYYFPLVTRLAAVDVIKGPAAIVHGPATIGGAVDLRTAAMADARAGYLDLAGGSDGYGKLHLRATERWRRFGVQAEYVGLRSDGWKRLDGGGATGFRKDDVELWLRRDETEAEPHRLDLRVGFARERSHESYLGLTDADLAADPARRYRASADDLMRWTHWRGRLRHRYEWSATRRIETTAYRHDFARVWSKVDGFVGERDLNAILARPERGANAIYYAVLTGAADSTSPEDELIVGENDRTFVSQGVQTALQLDERWGPTAHQLDLGVRLHYDRAHRVRRETVRAMRGGALVATARPTATVSDTRADVLALALYAHDRVRWGRLEASGGLRIETLELRFADQQGDARAGHPLTAVVPGGGVVVHATPSIAVLAGLHRGFAPPAPGPSATPPRPEASVNLEAGVRVERPTVRATALGFVSDYRNLKGDCTFASGCDVATEGEQFDGGRAQIWGAEIEAEVERGLGASLTARGHLAYTFTDSRFATAFTSEFAAWGEVEVGDELPYLPPHQLALTAELGGARWDVNLRGRWQAAARDQAGQGPVPPEARLDDVLTVAAGARVRWRALELYLDGDNLLDRQVVASRRPYGARANPPRQVVLGVKGHL
jgi:Fe(3+) dicitrate transport protein